MAATRGPSRAAATRAAAAPGAAEQPQRELRVVRIARDPIDRADQTLRQQRNIEDVGAIAFLFQHQQIEQERRETRTVQGFGDRELRGLKRLEPLPWAKTIRPFAFKGAHSVPGSLHGGMSTSRRSRSRSRVISTTVVI